MNVRFANQRLKDVDGDAKVSTGHGASIDKGFRKLMMIIRAAVDERDIYARPAVRFEKLSGKREHQHSMRINDQYRLIVELEGSAPNKVVAVRKIEDYH